MKRQWIVWLGLLCLGLGIRVVEASGPSGAVQISSDVQIYQPVDGKTQFVGNVRVATDTADISGSDANIQVKDGQADTAVFTNGAKLVRKGNQRAKQTIQADTIQMGFKSEDMTAKGHVATMIASNPVDTEKPTSPATPAAALAVPAAKTPESNFSIVSDNQVFEQDKHLMRAEGHVVVKKEDTTISSPDALVFMAPSGGVDKAVFVHGAQLSQKDQDMKADTITFANTSGSSCLTRSLDFLIK